jgi:hypothetical protein
MFPESSASSIAELAARLGPGATGDERVKVAAELRGAAALGGDAARQRIATSPGALARLVAMMSDRGEPQAQVHAAALVRQLAKGDEGSRAGSAPGMLPALLALLPQGSEPQAQLHATWALCNLCTGASRSAASMRELVVDAGALAPLGALLEPGHPTAVHEAAARAFWALGQGGMKLKARVCDAPGVLDSLAAALHPAWGLQVQLQAAWALHSVTSLGSARKRRAVATRGVVPGLVALIAPGNDPKLQEVGVATLRSLSTADAGTPPKSLPVTKAGGILFDAEDAADWSGYGVGICIAQTEGAIAALTELAAHGSSRAAREHAQELLRAVGGFAGQEVVAVPASGCCCW